jgi:hypothetical protein
MRKLNTKFSSALVAVAIALFSLLSGCSGGSSDANNSSAALIQAANDGLVTLRQLATGSDFDFYGYKSESDIGKETLGAPLSIKTLDFEKLISSESYSQSLIIDANEYLFPVFVNDETITSLRVGKLNDGSWGLVSTEADANDFDLAEETIKTHNFYKASCYLVDLEEIELLLLGCQRSGDLRLIPLYTPSEAFEIDKEYSFNEIIGPIKNELLAQKGADPNAPTISGLLDLPSSDNQSVSIKVATPSPASIEIDQSTKSSNLLAVPLIGQSQGQWCWAATAEMTMKFAAGTAPPQCSQATKAQDTYKFSKQASKLDCCLSGNAGTKFCNNPWYPEYDKWAFQSQYYEKAPTWGDLKFLIDSNKPLAFLWRWKPISDGNAHYMVAVGYKVVSGKQFVLYLDPYPVGKGKKVAIPFAEWLGGDSPNYDHVFGIYFSDISR